MRVAGAFAGRRPGSAGSGPRDALQARRGPRLRPGRGRRDMAGFAIAPTAIMTESAASARTGVMPAFIGGARRGHRAQRLRAAVGDRQHPDQRPGRGARASKPLLRGSRSRMPGHRLRRGGAPEFGCFLDRLRRGRQRRHRGIIPRQHSDAKTRGRPAARRHGSRTPVKAGGPGVEPAGSRPPARAVSSCARRAMILRLMPGHFAASNP